jgi:hypothetical protein
MRDRTDEEGACAGGGARLAQGLAVDGSRREQPRRHRVLVLALQGPAFLSFDGTRSAGHDRNRGGAADHIGREAAGLPIEIIAAEIAEHTTKGAFARDEIPTPQRVTPGPQPRQDLLRGTADHCQIAATESLPTTNTAHAANANTTTNSCRNPRRLRRSGTRDSLVSSEDPAPTGSAPAWTSSRARPANWPRTGLIDDTADTSAAPERILRRKHLKDHQKPRSSVHPDHPSTTNTPHQNRHNTQNTKTPGPWCNTHIDRWVQAAPSPQPHVLSASSRSQSARRSSAF